ncbi:universal stress protein PHOS34 isoform X2 [Neltuma alba]|uniref:universal stress protein PHOS34 isoform X2 n=1 Tax=Neltuma alba TaxID=207710 RepID=UPI0010A33180|nr:universal stress protein PHOS34-like isoform X2 [Prosopis alba]
MMETRGGDLVGGGMKMKAVVAIDESDGSFYALKWALDNLFAPMAAVGPLATDPDPPPNEGLLFLVHVQPTFYPPVYPVGPAAFAAPAVMDAVKKAQEEISARIISKALQMCKDKLVRAESVIMNGDPREMICQAAEKMQVDLLVMGSRGLGTFKRAILGSVSDYCAHHAKTPILIVKPNMELHHKH